MVNAIVYLPRTALPTMLSVTLVETWARFTRYRWLCLDTYNDITGFYRLCMMCRQINSKLLRQQSVAVGDWWNHTV